MPIYEYYCPDNNTIYQFFAKTLSQGQSIPKCPDNPAYRMEKIVSSFAITRGDRKGEDAESTSLGEAGGEADGDPRMEAALNSMESEFASIDENDPKAMGRMMRRMAELTGEKMDGEMEEVVRKLEEGTDPEKLEEQLGVGDEGEGTGDDPYGMGGGAGPGAPVADPKEPKHRYRQQRKAPFRDPVLYDY